MTVVPCVSTTTSALDTSRPLPMCEITPPLQRIVSASKMPISKSPETSVPIFLIARILISHTPNSGLKYGTSRGLALNHLIFEPEALVSLDDAARGRLGEMCCTHHHVAVAIPLQETPPRGSCEGGVKIGAHDPLWFHTLHGTVDAISGNDRLGALRCQVNADMSWG